jgi:hypothetical protein
MRRRNVLIAIGALIVLGIGGFGAARILFAKTAGGGALIAAKPSTCDDTFRVLKLAPSMITAARPVCLKQSLQFSGEVSGAVGQAYPVEADGVAATSMCGVPKRWDGFPRALLALEVGGKAYRLRISPPGWSEHQAVTLHNPQGQLDLASIADPKADWSQASGSVGINTDGISGSIDADVVRDVSGARPVHVAGTWACGTRVVPSADAATPCSLFYALNHLQDADVARMKARACITEDLSFRGAISAHLDHAINDAAYAVEPGIEGDNNCSAVGNQYDASLKFSVGDESFLLNLTPRAYPSVGPGQYAAGSGPFSANAFVWLGTADPSHHGIFVTDEHVYWYGAGGSFTIAADMKSGTVDETFSGMFEHSSSTLHVTGSWRCA